MSKATVTNSITEKSFIQKLIPHFIILAIFLIIASVFCSPWLQGNKILPHDVEQWLRMSKESRDYKEATGNTAFWVNNNFAGMPNALTDPYYEGNLFGAIKNWGFFYQHGEVISPIFLFFWAMLGAYILGLALGFKKWIAAIAGIAFAFSSYNPIIIAAGHTTKMVDIAYFPGVLAGVLIAYRGKYLRGAALAGTFVAFSLAAGHYQIIYYSIFGVVALAVSELIKAIKNGQMKNFMVASAFLLVGAALAGGTSTSRIMLTEEVTEYTIRGNQKEMGDATENSAKGLDKDYAFKWSNGIEETFALLVPNLYGGGHLMHFNDDNKLTVDTRIPAASVSGISYWGPQQSDGLGGSIYFGAVIVFLFILSLLVVRSKDKWWMVAASLFFIMLSWGKNFSAFNFLLFDTLPMMNKFRSPNMAMSMASLFFPILAAWAVNDIVTGKLSKEELIKKLKLGFGITAGLLVVMLLAAYTMMDFVGAMDPTIFKDQWTQLSAKVIDFRRSLAVKDILRSLFFVIVAAAVLWMFLKEKMNAKFAIVGIAVLVVFDMLPIANRYLGADKYLDQNTYDRHFAARPVDNEILKDKTYYRVLDLSSDLFNSSTASYFHKTIGGYHPAKLQIYQDLIANQIGKMNSAVINMLNGKYIINPDPSGKLGVIPNPGALGNAWFVNEVKVVNTAQEEMQALNAPSLSNPNDSTAGSFNPAQTVIVRASELPKLDGGQIAAAPTGGKVELTSYSPDKMVYSSNNTSDGIAVFSEIYYPLDWEAKIDGKTVPIARVNYVLRGLKIPAGAHTIEMIYHTPQSFVKGERVALICSIVLILMIFGGFYLYFREQRKKAHLS